MQGRDFEFREDFCDEVSDLCRRHGLDGFEGCLHLLAIIHVVSQQLPGDDLIEVLEPVVRLATRIADRLEMSESELLSYAQWLSTERSSASN